VRALRSLKFGDVIVGRVSMFTGRERLVYPYEGYSPAPILEPATTSGKQVSC
jgi:hypothetical protein